MFIFLKTDILPCAAVAVRKVQSPALRVGFEPSKTRTLNTPQLSSEHENAMNEGPGFTGFNEAERTCCFVTFDSVWSRSLFDDKHPFFSPC